MRLAFLPFPSLENQSKPEANTTPEDASSYVRSVAFATVVTVQGITALFRRALVTKLLRTTVLCPEELSYASEKLRIFREKNKRHLNRKSIY